MNTLNRLTKCVESERGLFTLQLGFRKGKSTVNAIRTVVEKASLQKQRGDRFCVVVTIAGKNAFNSASWEAIVAALLNMRVPGYLYRIPKNYFHNRVLVYEPNTGKRAFRVPACVSQGPILGPTHWNAMYNGVLTPKLSASVIIVRFADHVELAV